MVAYSEGTHGGGVGSACHGELGGVESIRGREAGLDATEPFLDALGIRWHTSTPAQQHKMRGAATWVARRKI